MNARGKRTLGIAVLALLLGYGLYAFLTRPTTSEEARIRGSVEAMAARAEDADANGLLALVDDGYHDNRGNGSKSAFAATLKALLAHFALKQRLAVSIERCDVTYAPGAEIATVALTFASWTRDAGAPRSLVVPSGARRVEYELEMVRGTDSTWRVRQAKQIREESVR